MAADTTVVIDGRFIGEPADRAEALISLRALPGRTHAVYTGVAVLSDAGFADVTVTSEVTFVKAGEESWTDTAPRARRQGPGVTACKRRATSRSHPRHRQRRLGPPLAELRPHALPLALAPPASPVRRGARRGRRGRRGEGMASRPLARRPCGLGPARPMGPVSPSAPRAPWSPTPHAPHVPHVPPKPHVPRSPRDSVGSHDPCRQCHIAYARLCTMPHCLHGSRGSRSADRCEKGL